MKVSNKVYGEVIVRFAKTPTEYQPEVKVEDGTVFVKAKWDDNTLVWVSAAALDDEKIALDHVLHRLISWTATIALFKLNMTKAELKRLMVKEHLLSK